MEATSVLYNASFLPVLLATLCCAPRGSVPRDAVLPQLILSGFPTGRSSPGTAPHGSVPRGPPSGAAQAPSPPRAAPYGLRLRPGAALRGYPWAVPPPGLSHCCTVGSSVAAREICSAWSSHFLTLLSHVLLPPLQPSCCQNLDM